MASTSSSPIPLSARNTGTSDQPYIYAEFRGVVERIEEDPTGAFYNTLSDHYKSSSRYRGDPRVILYIKIQHVVGQNL
jgi:hypothetical protein